ncbi:MAG: hypothetical protein R3A48_18175 [Polyangiales bacterium]
MSVEDSHWNHALRAGIDAVVLQFEAQVRALHAQHQALAAQREQAARAEIDALREGVKALRAELAARDESVRTLDAALQREAAECARLREALRRSEGDAARAAQALAEQSRALAEKSQELDVLGEQFAAEAGFVEGARGAAGTILGDALEQSLGAPFEATPACYGALKSKRLEMVLGGAMRERGRTVARAPLTDAELTALAAMASAAGCELVRVEAGARYAASSMEKVGTRAEPAEEDLVLECAMPGLRVAGTQGLAVQPRVIVGAA